MWAGGGVTYFYLGAEKCRMAVIRHKAQALVMMFYMLQLWHFMDLLFFELQNNDTPSLM
jgi:hypothetical protein